MKHPPRTLPDKPGIYLFRGPKRAVLYIGKATSLRSRVASYFRRDLMETRGPIIVSMVEAATAIDHIETNSVLEALILEAALIKKHQPPYNTKEKSDKSFNYVVITDEDYPRVLTMRGKLIKEDATGIRYAFGPFPQGSTLRDALKIIRKIFPFRDKCTPCVQNRTRNTEHGTHTNIKNASRATKCKSCFNAQIGLCPGVCSGVISKAEYAKTIRRIKLFFEGKKQALLVGIERDMKKAAKELKFEEATKLKKTLFALTHIQDVALLKSDFEQKQSAETFRIEAYDVAHIAGTHTAGVMTVLQNGEVKKNEYRKFKIKATRGGDTASLREMLERRFNHSEWLMPKLIVVDGGKAQINTAEQALAEWGIKIPVVGVVKDEHHRPREILGLQKAGVSEYERAILLANNEAHRFAVGYHRTLRGKLK